jgi:hypothetical protein
MNYFLNSFRELLQNFVQQFNYSDVRIRSGNQIFSKPPKSEAFEGFPCHLTQSTRRKTDIIIQRQRRDEKSSPERILQNLKDNS